MKDVKGSGKTERNEDRFGSFVKFEFKSLRYEIRTLLLATIIGIVGGIGAVVFRLLITFFYLLFFYWPHTFLTATFPTLSPVITVLSPTLGGLVVGTMVYKLASEAKGHGVPEIIEAVNMNNGRMRLRVPFIKILASAITIGSGGSAGREGPIAQIGGGFASGIAQKLNLSAEETKTMVVAGVSAGIAATFNAPLGGVMFGIELIRRDMRSFSILPLVTSSVIGTFIGDLFLGSQPAFIFPKYELEFFPLNIPVFMIFGIVMAVLAVLWVRGFYWIEDLFEKIPLTPVLVTGIGGLIVGVIELFYPQVNGISYEPIDRTFALELPAYLLLILVFAKFLATSASIGSGGSGGVFAPTLFMGVMLGTAAGYLLVFLGYGAIPVPVMALLGMAALFAGAAKAPLTAIIMTSEMTDDFQLILPLMFTVVTAWVISSLLLKNDDIYTMKLKRRGVRFKPAVDVFEDLLVTDIMVKNPETINYNEPVRAVLTKIKKTGHTGYPVLKEGEIFGIVTEHDINKLGINFNSTSVADICCRKIVSVTRDCPVSKAFMMMLEKGINRLPVVESKESNKMIGWITRSDIMKAYWIAKSANFNYQNGFIEGT